MTAEEIRKNQAIKWSEAVPEVVKLPVLREQDFGSHELVPWTSRRADTLTHVPRQGDTDHKPQETSEAMRVRAESFLGDYILPILATLSEDTDDTKGPEECVAVVSHGLFLSVLWKSLLRKFPSNSVVLGPGVEPPGRVRPLEYLPAWSNTGFLELSIKPTHGSDSSLSANAESMTVGPDISLLSEKSLMVHAVNSKDHLQNLKRTRGGVGSAPFDARQKSIDGFFKRPKAP
jgi:hypothetical protein